MLTGDPVGLGASKVFVSTSRMFPGHNGGPQLYQRLLSLTCTKSFQMSVYSSLMSCN